MSASTTPALSVRKINLSALIAIDTDSATSSQARLKISPVGDAAMGVIRTTFSCARSPWISSAITLRTVPV
jgi:hypothetical protein